MTAAKNIEVKNVETTEATISAKELAAEMNVNAKSLRRFMRSLTDERAGRGGSWKITRSQADAIIARYEAGGNRKSVDFQITK